MDSHSSPAQPPVHRAAPDPAPAWRSLIGPGDSALVLGADADARLLELSERVGDSGVVHVLADDRAGACRLDAVAAQAPRRNIIRHIGQNVAQDFAQDVAPERRSIDSLALPGVDLILLYCPAQALRQHMLGALATLAGSRPAIVCAGAAAASEELASLAQDLSFRPFVVSRDDLVLLPREAAPRLLRRLREDGQAPRPIIAADSRYGDGAEEDYGGAEDCGGADDARSGAAPDRPLLIALAFYKAPELVGFVADGLERIADELRRNACRILFYNDSPDHQPLRAALDAAAPRLKALGGVVIDNPANLGFIATMNLAFAEAERDGRDLLLLNSDAMPAPGAIDEMRLVAAQDEMIGFVCPRSNNATLATIGEPTSADFDAAAPRRALERRLRAATRILPRVQYTPTNVGFCLLVKHRIIAEFGALSPEYGQGYNEENDYVMRAGQCGFRAALANWAYAYHIGEKSFAQSDAQRRARDLANREILVRRYPEYPRLEANYFASETYRSEFFLTQLARPRVRFAIDATALFVGHNGTQILIATLARQIARLYGACFDLVLIGDPAALAYHGLDALAGARLSSAEDDESFDLILRIGQPFDGRAPVFMAKRAPVNIVFMLDTIALDCAQLTSPQLEALWSFVMSSADGVIYNSAFTRQQFRHRFAIDPRWTAELVSRHSLNPAEYAFGAPDGDAAAPRQGHVLIVGNHFPHKNVTPTYQLLAQRAPERKYVALGAETGSRARENGVVDEFFTAGQLPDALIAGLYRHADLVVFPSFYEGFGFPIETALATQKPVLARDNRINREIAALLGSPNLRLYRDGDELVTLIRAGLSWRAEPPAVDRHDWAASAREIVDFCLMRLNASSTARVRSRRIALRALQAEIAPPPAIEPPASREPAPIVEAAPEPPAPTATAMVSSEADPAARRILLKSLRSFMTLQRLKGLATLWSAKRRRRYRAALREASHLRARIEARGVRLPTEPDAQG